MNWRFALKSTWNAMIKPSNMWIFNPCKRVFGSNYGRSGIDKRISLYSGVAKRLAIHNTDMCCISNVFFFYELMVWTFLQLVIRRILLNTVESRDGRNSQLIIVNRTRLPSPRERAGGRLRPYSAWYMLLQHNLCNIRQFVLIINYFSCRIISLCFLSTKQR